MLGNNINVKNRKINLWYLKYSAVHRLKYFEKLLSTSQDTFGAYLKQNTFSGDNFSMPLFLSLISPLNIPRTENILHF